MSIGLFVNVCCVFPHLRIDRSTLLSEGHPQFELLRWCLYLLTEEQAVVVIVASDEVMIELPDKDDVARLIDVVKEGSLYWTVVWFCSNKGQHKSLSLSNESLTTCVSVPHWHRDVGYINFVVGKSKERLCPSSYSVGKHANVSCPDRIRKTSCWLGVSIGQLFALGNSSNIDIGALVIADRLNNRVAFGWCTNSKPHLWLQCSRSRESLSCPCSMGAHGRNLGSLNMSQHAKEQESVGKVAYLPWQNPALWCQLFNLLIFDLEKIKFRKADLVLD